MVEEACAEADTEAEAGAATARTMADTLARAEARTAGAEEAALEGHRVMSFKTDSEPEANAHDTVNRVQPMPNAAAKRMRRYRQRRRDGLRCVTVQLRETEVDMLICRALLKPEMRHNKNAIINACMTTLIY